MIIRVEKNRNNPFVMMDKRPVEDTRLSWKAKGLLAYLLSRPDDWIIRVNDLIKRSTEGKAAVRAGLAELERFGYLTRDQPRAKKGQFASIVYVVHEMPLSKNDAVAKPEQPRTENRKAADNGRPVTDYREAGKRETGKREAGNRTHTKIDTTKKEETTKKEYTDNTNSGTESPPSPPPKKRKPKPKTKTPPSVLAFRRGAHRYPPKSWYSKVAAAVGEEESDLEFWELLVTAYVGQGWNPGNVSAMLEFYSRREIPGNSRTGPQTPKRYLPEGYEPQEIEAKEITPAEVAWTAVLENLASFVSPSIITERFSTMVPASIEDGRVTVIATREDGAWATGRLATHVRKAAAIAGFEVQIETKEGASIA